METPNDPAGATTELIMAAWLRRLQERKEPKPTTAAYNAAYEACYAILSNQEAPSFRV